MLLGLEMLEIPASLGFLECIRAQFSAITLLFYLIGHNDLVLAFSVNHSFVNKEVVFAI